MQYIAPRLCAICGSISQQLSLCVECRSDYKAEKFELMMLKYVFYCVTRNKNYSQPVTFMTTHQKDDIDLNVIVILQIILGNKKDYHIDHDIYNEYDKQVIETEFSEDAISFIESIKPNRNKLDRTINCRYKPYRKRMMDISNNKKQKNQSMR
jgi:hypothetical protein